MTALAEALRAQAHALLVLAEAAEQAPPAQPFDDLLPLTSEATGFELCTLRKAKREGRLATEKHGRRVYVRRSALAALAEPLPEPDGLAERAASAPKARRAGA